MQFRRGSRRDNQRIKWWEAHETAHDVAANETQQREGQRNRTPQEYVDDEAGIALRSIEQRQFPRRDNIV